MEDYEVQYKWFETNKEMKSELNVQRYTNAVATYERKMLKYDARVAKYQDVCPRFGEILDQYYADVDAWYERENERMIYHEQVLVEQSKRDYAKANASRLKAYNEAYDKYTVEYGKWMEQQVNEGRMNGVGQFGSYIFKTKNLNWVNCDRLYSIPPSDVMAVKVNAPDYEDQRVFVIENNNTTITQAWKNNRGTYETKAVKSNNPLVFAYKVEDGQLYAFSQPANANQAISITYEPVTFKELSDMMKGIKT
jgi:hypothetical protein